MTKKVCLIVLDGWGVNDQKVEFDAIANTETLWMDLLTHKYPSFLVHASGEHVGLEKDQMGNSEVGHLIIGAGRCVEQDVIRINNTISSERMGEHCSGLNTNYKNNKLHIIGLLSNGGVHSHINHIKSLVRNALADHVCIHAISDGRDTSPSCFLDFCNEMSDFCDSIGKGKIVSVAGRYYAMDRDNKMDRTRLAHETMSGDVVISSKISDIVNNFYSNKITDEFFEPVLLDVNGKICDGETILFANFRADRMRQLFDMFNKKNKCYTLTRYYEENNPNVLFERPLITNHLVEVLSNNNKTHLHVAESEKFAHVTYFLKGGSHKEFPPEKCIIEQSPKVKSYDLQPEMSINNCVVRIFEGIRDGYDFIVANFAPPDMVGHTGEYDATCKAIAATDEAIGLVYEACKEKDYTLFIVSDHGNAEIMKDESGESFKKHTKNQVPFIICTGANSIGAITKSDKSLQDVAPTILDYMQIPVPKEMTGQSIFKTHKHMFE